MILAFIALVLTMIFVVGIHEAGHALAAKWFSVKIQRISIGFGKPLLLWRGKSGCEWVWALWPLGGYVQLLNSRIQAVPTNDLAFCFDKKPVWIRCFILLAGAFANLLTAWVALTLFYLWGFQLQAPVIQTVVPQSIAAQAGLKGGDRFVQLAGQKTDSWQDVGMGLLMKLGKAKVSALVTDNAGKTQTIYLDLRYWNYKKERQSLFTALGIEPDQGAQYTYQVEGRPFYQAVYQALHKILQLLTFFLVLLKQLVTGVVPFGVLLGPLGLLAVSVNSFLQGLTVFLYFIASLSLAVGLVNLFPVPGLDGSLIMYALVEKLSGKPLSIAMEILLYRLAMIIFFLVLIQLIMNDLRRLYL